MLGGLSLTVSPRFTHGFIVFGIAAGMVAGLCEELGWTGFAYPQMQARFGWLPGALLLGVLWGLWHLPVVDSPGRGQPARQVLAGILRRLYRRAGRRPGPDRLDLYPHREPADGLAAARLLHRVPGDPQRPAREPRPGGPLVHRLRRAAVGSRDHRDPAPAQVPHPCGVTTSREPRNSRGLCLVGNAK